MGTARAPVVGSTSCPACTESVARCCFLASAICSLLKIIAASERPAVWGRPQAYGKSGLVAFQPFGQWPKLPAQLPAWTRGQQQRGPLARRKVMLHSIKPTRVCWQVAAGFSRFQTTRFFGHLEKVLNQRSVRPINRQDGTTG